MSAHNYTNACDLARAALRMLDLAASSNPANSDIELGAVALANHVADWHFYELGIEYHYEPYGRQFAEDFPNWDAIRNIVNKIKHPEADASKRASYPDLTVAVSREIKFDDHDFWNAPQKTATLFVDLKTVLRDKTVEIKPRSIHSLVFGFCSAYLEWRSPNRPKKIIYPRARMTPLPP